jgi:di/tricarboxylate transporter
MNTELQIVLVLLGACVGMFAANKPRMDVVALLPIILLPLTGVLSVGETLSGFSDPNVVLIAALFVIGEGLVRTGVAYRIGDFLIERSGKSETSLLVLLMLTVAGLGAFMSSTGVVAIFIPVVLGICRKMKTSPSRLMMPLSFAGLISGMLTLVATPPNMVVDGALKRAGLPGFGFFSFAPIGLLVLLAGIGYMLLVRRWLGRDSAEVAPADERRNLQSLIEQYQVAGRTRCLRVGPDSPLSGKTLAQLALRREHRLNVIAIDRRGRILHESLPPQGSTELRFGDVLLVDHCGEANAVSGLPDELGLQKLPHERGYLARLALEVGMAEIMLPPDSRLIGHSVRDAGFRTKYGLNVVGLRRQRRTIGSKFLEKALRSGDTLLVMGSWKSIHQLQSRRRDFVVLSLPVEFDAAAPAHAQAPFALAGLLLMIVLMVSGVVPNVLAALLVCMLLLAARVIEMDGAYRAIHWPSLMVIVGMMPFAIALEKTGGIELAVAQFVELLGQASPRVMLASLFLLTALTGMFISNTATAVLMAPIALSIADYIGVSPRPFAMTVALAASAAFMTPVSSPVNTLVVGPGQYRFGDFVKVGVPFTLLVMIITVTVVPWLFPFEASGLATAARAVATGR